MSRWKQWTRAQWKKEVDDFPGDGRSRACTYTTAGGPTMPSGKVRPPSRVCGSIIPRLTDGLTSLSISQSIHMARSGRVEIGTRHQPLLRVTTAILCRVRTCSRWSVTLTSNATSWQGNSSKQSCMSADICYISSTCHYRH